jgi:hypothetical protein
MDSTRQLAGLIVLHYNVGSIAETPGGYVPNQAFFDLNLPAKMRLNRAPGDIKPLYKWLLGLRNHPNLSNWMEFKQVLS